MKNLLSVLSLVLVLVMLASVSTFGASYSEYDVGQTVHYVGKMADVEPDVTDGVISEGEYSSSYDGSVVSYTNTAWKPAAAGATKSRKMPLGQPQNVMDSESIKFYFSEGADHYYLGIEQIAGGTDRYYIARSNLMIRVGFDTANSLYMIHYGNGGWTSGVRDCTSEAQNSEHNRTMGLAIEAMYATKYTEETAGSGDFNLIYAGENSPNASGANGWTTARQKNCYEIKFSKAELAKALGFSSADALPEAILLTIGTEGLVREASATSGELDRIHTLRTGAILKEDAAGLVKGAHIGDVIVFGEDPKATTEPETTAPAVSVEISEETESSEVEILVEPEGGCGSTVSFAGLALVAAVGACAVVIKKKED